MYPGAALTATALSLHGYRKGSLSASGAATAWVVGYLHLAGPLKLFGVSLIVFYLVGSRATKVKAAAKAKLEQGPDPSRPGGNRNWAQVLSTSLPTLIIALIYGRYFSRETHLHSSILALDARTRPLLYGALAHFSTALADTLASELGILSPSPPMFILTLRPVPPGTNGGVSILGLAASAAGGLIMALTMVLDLLVENPPARGMTWDRAQKQIPSWKTEMVVLGVVMGLIGSLLDSLLGATLQRTLYDTTSKRIITDHASCASGTERPVSAQHGSAAAQPQHKTESAVAVQVKQIGPGVDVLSNSNVNLVCAVVMTLLGVWYGRSW